MLGSALKRHPHPRRKKEVLNRDRQVLSSQPNAQSSKGPAESLRLRKDGPDVELDWATGRACENYVVRRSSNAQFSGQVTHDGLQQSAYTDSGAADPLVDRTNYFYLVESANPTPIRWYVRDHRGSTLLALDEQGEVAASYEYHPFGDIKSSTSSCENPGMLYQGSPRDDRTGLDDLGARHYSSVLDRFLVPDSVMPDLGSPSEWNLYLYTANDPVNFVDPNGRERILIGTDLQKAAFVALRASVLESDVTGRIADADRTVEESSTKHYVYLVDEPSLKESERVGPVINGTGSNGVVADTTGYVGLSGMVNIDGYMSAAAQYVHALSHQEDFATGTRVDTAACKTCPPGTEVKATQMENLIRLVPKTQYDGMPVPSPLSVPSNPTEPGKTYPANPKAARWPELVGP